MDKIIDVTGKKGIKLYCILSVVDSKDEKAYELYCIEHDIKYGFGPTFKVTNLNGEDIYARYMNVAMDVDAYDVMSATFGFVHI